jgi:hypothetical protein
MKTCVKYIYDNIWLNSSWNEKCFIKYVEKFKTRFIFNIFFFFGKLCYL